MRGLTISVVVMLVMLFITGFQSINQPFAQETQRQSQPIKLATDLVSLKVTVTDKKGWAVSQLNKEDFKVCEDGVENQITFFSEEESPTSWGLVLDYSSSMSGMMQDVYRAAIHVIDESNKQDEVFIVAFNSQTETICNFTSDKHTLENSVFNLSSGGSTSLYDAVAFALEQIQKGKYKKKVLVVVTDGVDNSSSLNFHDLIKLVEEKDVLIYTVGMVEPMRTGRINMETINARNKLEKLAEVTGAFANFPTNAEQCLESMKKIVHQVSHQYSLAYYPSNTNRDGKWRKIQVIIERKKNQPKYSVQTRAGYYSPREN